MNSETSIAKAGLTGRVFSRRCLQREWDLVRKTDIAFSSEELRDYRSERRKSREGSSRKVVAVGRKTNRDIRK